MKRLYPLLLALFMGTSLSAQIEIEKLYKPGIGNLQDARDMIKATGGGYFITGETKDANNEKAMFVLKVDDNLDSLWTKHYRNPNFISQRGDVLMYNSTGNLCVVGIMNGPGVHLAFWELNLDGDTIKTRTFATGTNGIEFLVPDALVTSDDDYIVLVQNGTTSGSVHSFDSDWNLNWKKYGSSTGGWPEVDVNAQFVGVEMIDTVLYYAARKASGADNKSFFVKSGVSGAYMGVKQYGVNAQGIRAEDLVLTENNEALLVGSMTVEVSPGLSSARTMLLRTNLDGDSLGIFNDLEAMFPHNASIIDGNVVVDCQLPTESSGAKMGIGVYNQNGFIVGKQELEELANDWDQSTRSAIRTLDATGGKRVTMGVTDDNYVLLIKYTEDLILGEEEIGEAKHAYSIYPNPTPSQFTIQGLTGNEQVQIHNLLGEVVYAMNATSTTELIDLEDVETGVYIVQISSQQNERTYCYKLVVQ